MRPLIFLLLLCALAGQVTAQTENYFILSAGFGNLFPRDPAGGITQSFSYTTRSTATGATASQSFSGSLNRAFPGTVSMIDLSNIEYVTRHTGLDFGVGTYRDIGSTYSAYLKGGYRYIFFFKGFQLKPALDFYYLFGSSTDIGRIDNKGMDIDLLGYTAASRFIVSYTDPVDGTTTDTKTFDADHLDISYRRDNFLAKPSIILSTNIKALTLSLEAGWMLQLGQSSFLQLTQVAPVLEGEDSRTLGKVSLNKNGSMGGPYVGVSIGFNFGHTPSLPRRKSIFNFSRSATSI